jgi:limonene-1,2-epoxide hydrolase
MRAAVAVVLAVVAGAVLGGCGSGSPSAESVVRAWNQALNDDDNNRAADLFAHGAEVVQAGRVLKLRTHDDAVAWNAALPCSGRIVSITSHANTAKATFVLGDRKSSKCDGPGARATAIFKVVKGKIVLWHQTGNSDAPPPPQV